jgi:hypothetical protein
MIEAKAIAAASAREFGAYTPTAARKLSGRDVAHMLRLPPVGDDVAELLIASIDHEIGEAAEERKTLLLRDKVMFTAARCLHLSVPRLLQLETGQFPERGGQDFSFWDPIDTADRAALMLDWYQRRVRPHLLREDDVRNLFVTNDGQPLHSSAVGMRFERAVRKAGLKRAIPSWTHWASSRRQISAPSIRQSDNERPAMRKAAETVSGNWLSPARR